jgi:uncharacterized protein
MIKNIILQHKAERDLLLNKSYVQRIDSIQIEYYLGTNLIKLITGPRRAGKSVLALQLLKEKNFAYLNFDDDQLLKYFDEVKVFQELKVVYQDYRFLLLDEIQNLPDWELLVAKLYRRDYNLIVTGSNARLLSRELATSLTGRFLQIVILPFSFAEFTRVFQKENSESNPILSQLSELYDDGADKYISLGGFPEVVLNQSIAKNYLSSLFDSILLKDIVKRFKIRKPQYLFDLSGYLLTNYTNLFSLNQLKDDLNFNSVTTVQKYIDYLQESYLFITLPRFSFKLKEHQKSNKKVYVIDNGFIKARSFELSPNYGRMMENIVFIELLRRNYHPGLTLFYYRTRNDKEVDFILRQNHITEKLVQVCYDINTSKTLKRETDALIEASGELSCQNLWLINRDRDEVLQKGDLQVRLVPVVKFLMEGTTG